MSRALALLGALSLAGCSTPAGLSWAEGRMGKAGAQAILAAASAWISEHPTEPTPVEAGAARCPSPRVVLDVYTGDRTSSHGVVAEFSRVSKLAPDEKSIDGDASVRCLVLVAHSARGKKRNFKEKMQLRLVDREAAKELGVELEGNDEELAAFLSRLP